MILFHFILQLYKKWKVLKVSELDDNINLVSHVGSLTIDSFKTIQFEMDVNDIEMVETYNKSKVMVGWLTMK